MPSIKSLFCHSAAFFLCWLLVCIAVTPRRLCQIWITPFLWSVSATISPRSSLSCAPDDRVTAYFRRHRMYKLKYLGYKSWSDIQGNYDRDGTNKWANSIMSSLKEWRYPDFHQWVGSDVWTFYPIIYTPTLLPPTYRWVDCSDWAWLY